MNPQEKTSSDINLRINTQLDANADHLDVLQQLVHNFTTVATNNPTAAALLDEGTKQRLIILKKMYPMPVPA